MKKPKRGGKRSGAGRPKGEPSTTIRVPITLANQIKQGRIIVFPVGKCACATTTCEEPAFS